MLNPDLDIPRLRSAYAQRRALSIPNILQPEIAEHLYRALATADWNLEINDYGPSPRFRMPLNAEFAGASPQHLLETLDHGMDPKKLFYVRMSVEGQQFNDPQLIAFRDFVNSSEFIRTMEAITGESGLTHSWIEATGYSKGCFLGGHRDDHHPQNVIAMVFNLTKTWQLDWGGLLMLVFPGEAPAIVPPVWNSLSLFSVPLDHLVSAVSPAATETRYSLTGWLRR
jgi:hypothetical protein